MSDNSTLVDQDASPPTVLDTAPEEGIENSPLSIDDEDPLDVVMRWQLNQPASSPAASTSPARPSTPPNFRGPRWIPGPGEHGSPNFNIILIENLEAAPRIPLSIQLLRPRDEDLGKKLCFVFEVPDSFADEGETPKYTYSPLSRLMSAVDKEIEENGRNSAKMRITEPTEFVPGFPIAIIEWWSQIQFGWPENQPWRLFISEGGNHPLVQINTDNELVREMEKHKVLRENRAEGTGPPFFVYFAIQKLPRLPTNNDKRTQPFVVPELPSRPFGGALPRATRSSSLPADASSSIPRPSSPPTSLEPEKAERDPVDIFQELHEKSTGQDGVKLDAHLPVAPSPSDPNDDEWRDVCDLLMINPNDHLDPVAYSIPLPHAGVSVSPRQLWTAYLMLDGRCDGGFLADDMGTGKSHVLLAYILLRILILTSARNVELDARRAAGARQHRAQALAIHCCRCETQATSSRPSRRTADSGYLGIKCYLPATSITRRLAMKLSTGPTLLQVPTSAMSVWTRLLNSAMLNPEFFRPILFHTAGFAPEALRMPPVGELNRALAWLTKAKVPQETRDQHAEDWQPTVMDAEFTFEGDRLDTRFTPARRGDRVHFPEKWIFLTTHGKPPNFVENNELRIVTENGLGRPPKLMLGASIGVHIVDEFHQVNGANSDTVALAKELRHMRNGNFKFWAVSGTPLSRGAAGADLRAILPVLEILETKGKLHRDAVASLVADISASRASGLIDTAAECERLAPKIAAVLSDELIIRNTVAESRFFGKPISDVKPSVVEFLSVPTPLDLVQDVDTHCRQVLARLQTKIDSNDPVRVFEEAASGRAYRDLESTRLLSTFPGAATYLLRGLLDASTSAINAELATLDDRTNPGLSQRLTNMLLEVITDSPKLRIILDKIDEMLASRDRRVRPAPQVRRRIQETEDLAMQKMVIVTSTLCEAVFLHLAITQHRPAVKPRLLPGSIRASDRNAILEDWADLRPAPRGQFKTQVLITPFEIGGTALNLQTANWQIVTGPLRTRHDEAQAFGRTNRAGQELPVHHFLLATHDNPHDRVRMVRRAGAWPKTDLFDVKIGLDVTYERPKEVIPEEVPLPEPTEDEYLLDDAELYD